MIIYFYESETEPSHLLDFFKPNSVVSLPIKRMLLYLGRVDKKKRRVTKAIGTYHHFNRDERVASSSRHVSREASSSPQR